MSAEDYLAQGSEAFYANVASQLEAAMGKSMPKMEIRYTNLSVCADVVVATKDGHELPTLYNHAKKSLMSLFRTKRTIRKDILHPMSGVFKPGTLTLVLGQPASGKSTLMKVLSGQFQVRKNITVDGSVTFNGTPSNEVKKLVPQFASYVSQRDFHYPVMSVKETLEFAHACQQPKHILNALENSSSEEENIRAKALMQSLENVYPDIITSQMGLTQCRDTIVGNAMLRGVSGGERKRVTLGEMEFGMKMVSFLDEISTGLDSAATYDIVKAQKSMTQHLKKTIVIALLQPAPEVFELFDEVLLLNEGHVMYHGPRSQCLAYFESLGFKCPPKRDVADFLLDLGTQQQNQYIDYTSNSLPTSPSEYAQIFRQSTIYADSISSGSFACDADITHMKKIPEFTSSFFPITWSLAKRQAKVLARNKAYIRTRFVMTLLMSFLYSSTFYQMDPALSMNIVGLIYLAMLFLALGQIPLVPVLISSREIFYKQRHANFFRTSSFIIAQSMTQVPYAVLETVVFGSILYWVCGFADDFAAYIIYLVVLILSNLSFVGWLFFVTMMSPNLHVAKPLSMVSVLMHITFAGFIITGDNLPGYFVWIYWIDPFAWTLRALSVNQYSVAEFQKCVYKGVDYCEKFQKTMGNTQLKLLGLPTDTKWIGFAVIYLILCYCVFLCLTYFALEYRKPDSHGNHTVVTVRDDDEVPADHYVKAPKTPSENSAAITIDRPVSRVPQVVLAFKDLWYSVPNPTKGEPDLKLLKGINGYALPGTITALMGSSGAGKTTLMDVIAGRKTGGKIDGQILLNGYPATDLAIRRATGYCEQMDIHSESATFREAFQFSAMLRQSDDIPAAEKMAFAEECLDLLDMRNIADKIIRGSSVEQMKRLTIGVELAAAPSILFLDEPTSGLDARSAKIIMTGIRKIASTGRTVVCTIHQPSTEVFEMFDNLLLLKRGGETVFFGELGMNASHLINYFKSIPNTPALIEGANPATWMLEVIGAGVETKQTTIPAENFVERFQSSVEYSQMCQQVAFYAQPQPDLPELRFTQKRAASPTTQFKMLMQRFFRMYWRTPSYNFTRYICYLFLSLLLGVMYINVDYSAYSGATSGMGMMFMLTLFGSVVCFNCMLPLASEERPSFYRERACQTYQAWWYFVASTLVEIPYCIGLAVVIVATFYPLVGFSSSATDIFLFLLGFTLLAILSVSIGEFLAFAMPQVEIASLMLILINGIFSLFVGFNPPASQIPSGYRWLYHVTPLKYCLALLTSIAFGKCDDGSEYGCLVLHDVSPAILNKVGTPTITLKTFVAEIFEMRAGEVGWNILGIFVSIFVFRFGTLLSMQFLNYQKR